MLLIGRPVSYTMAKFAAVVGPTERSHQKFADVGWEEVGPYLARYFFRQSLLLKLLDTCPFQ